MSNIDRLTRRSFLIGASGLALTATSTAAERDRASPAPLATMPNRSAALLELSAVQAVNLMSSGELSAERYAQALLARCADQKALNAFITLEPERVLDAARAADRRRAAGGPLGALHGLPIPVKDSLNTRDYPTTAGTPALRAFRPAQDAPLVGALVGAGAIVLGKTNLHELSYGWTSNNLAFGAVHNPYDPTRIPGGSSGGTAAAVAAHMAPLGVAEDTEGSIRVPAALCGIAGFRPTTGRYSTQGAAPISALFDQAGPHARTVADIALFDAVASGDHQPLAALPLKGVKLAVARGYFYAGLDAEVERLTEAALAKLRGAGAEIVEAEVPDLDDLIGLITDQVQNHDVRVELPRYLKAYDAPVRFDEVVAQASPDIRTLFERDVLPGGPGFVSEDAYRAAVEIHLPKLRRIYRDYFARTGAMAMVFPATMVTAPRIGEDVEIRIRDQTVPFDVAVARNIAPGSTAGLPGLVLPAAVADNGLPVALEFDGPATSDRLLLALGLGVEAVLGRIAPPRSR
jgi:indoleacetamide hydrolase